MYQVLPESIIIICHSPRSTKAKQNTMNIRPQPQQAGNNRSPGNSPTSRVFFSPPVPAMPSVSDALSDDAA